MEGLLNPVVSMSVECVNFGCRLKDIILT